MLTATGNIFNTGTINISPIKDKTISGCDPIDYPNSLNWTLRTPIWSDPQKVPEDIKGKTLAEIFSSYGYNVYWSLIANVSGKKGYDCSSDTSFLLGAYRKSIDNIDNVTLETVGEVSSPGGFHSGTATFSGVVGGAGKWDSKLMKTSIPDSFIFQGSNQRCNCRDNTNVNITFTLTIGLSSACTGDLLKSQQCRDYCFPNDNPNNYCFTDVRDYCLSNTNYVDNDWCLDYLKAVGEEQQISLSGYLDDWCQKKFNIQKGTIDDVLNLPKDASKQQVIENSLCACHLEPQFYDNFYNTVTQLPDIDISGTTFGQKKWCLFPQCAQSGFQKVTSTQKECSGPVCMQVIDFDNQGIVDADNITFNQSSDGCLGIGGDNIPLTPLIPGETDDGDLIPLVPEETSGGLSKGLVIGLVVGGFILAFLIFAIAIYLFFR